MNHPRHVRVFKNGRNQAIRIPREMEPIERSSLLDLLATWPPLDIDFPEVPDAAPEPVDL
jgi:antitoxin VapB